MIILVMASTSITPNSNLIMEPQSANQIKQQLFPSQLLYRTCSKSKDSISLLDKELKTSKCCTYPDTVFFIGLKVDVKINISPLACSIACSSLSPTTERGGMLHIRKHKLITKEYLNERNHLPWP
jgi:hypothetical protein